MASVKKLKNQADYPFNETIKRLVEGIYSRHNTKTEENGGRKKTQEDVFESYIKSITNNTSFRRIVVLTMNFDDAFLHIYKPGLDIVPKTDFSEQLKSFFG